MSDLDPRRVPADTTEITYTAGKGEQVSIPVARKGRYAYASPASDGDARALDRMGFTTIARKAAAEGDSTDDETPAAGEQEG